MTGESGGSPGPFNGKETENGGFVGVYIESMRFKMESGVFYCVLVRTNGN